MNKLMIVLLAICFINYVNAFVKRDTELSKDDNGTVKLLKEEFQEIKGILEETIKHVNTDVIKKIANDDLDTLKKNVGEIQKKIDERLKN